MQMYPDWSARTNINRNKKRKQKKQKQFNNVVVQQQQRLDVYPNQINNIQLLSNPQQFEQSQQLETVPVPIQVPPPPPAPPPPQPQLFNLESFNPLLYLQLLQNQMEQSNQLSNNVVNQKLTLQEQMQQQRFKHLQRVQQMEQLEQLQQFKLSMERNQEGTQNEGDLSETEAD